MLIVLSLLKITNSSIAFGSLAEPLALILTLAGLNIFYTKWRPDQIISSVTFGLLVVTWSALIAGSIPIGGHYAADVLAGATLWSAFDLSGAWKAIAKSELTAARSES